MPIIVSESLRGSKFLSCIRIHMGDEDVIYDPMLLPHLLFECVPSSQKLAVVVCFVKDDESMGKVLRDMEKIQHSFRHCVSIVNTKDERWWYEVNRALKGGGMRLLWAHSFDQSVKMTGDLYTEMSSSVAQERLNRQQQFFQREKNKLCLESEASRVYETTLQSLGIESQQSLEILRDGFPSLQSLMNADLDLMTSISPVSRVSLQRIATFFNPKLDCHKN